MVRTSWNTPFRDPLNFQTLDQFVPVNSAFFLHLKETLKLDWKRSGRNLPLRCCQQIQVLQFKRFEVFNPFQKLHCVWFFFLFFNFRGLWKMWTCTVSTFTDYLRLKKKYAFDHLFVCLCVRVCTLNILKNSYWYVQSSEPSWFEVFWLIHEMIGKISL